MPPDRKKQEDLGTCCSCGDDTIIHHTDSSGEEFCEPCFDEYYTSCDGCSHTIALDDCHYGDDYPYCEDCFYDYYNYCESCSEATHCDYTMWRSDMPYCEHCCPNDTEDMIYNIENKDIPSYSRESETFVYPVRRLVGIEAECYVHDNSNMSTPKHWNNVSDGSINAPENYYGVEMVSHPANGDLLMDSVDRLIKWSRIYGANVNRSCGLHIHFNSIDLSAREVAHIGIVYSHFEEVLKGMMPKSRQSSNWCRDFPIGNKELRRIDSEEELIESYYEYMDSEPTQDKYNDARYCGLNIHSRYYHGSIEFRLHSGTLNKAKILNWISILNLIIIKGIELSKLENKEFDKWVKTSAIRHMVSTFGVELCAYINKRANKFKGERESE